MIAPAAIGLTVTMAVVIAMYMLRLRREDRRVPSTFLWRSILVDPPANAPWQPPRPSLLLALQLLALSLLIAALARPFLFTDQPAGDSLIFLLDRSASMAATDVAPTRMGDAKSRLLDVLDGSPGALVTVVAFDDTMEVLVSGSTDRNAVERALDSVTPRPVEGDISDALSFAMALAAGSDARIALYSDGSFKAPPSGVPPAVHFDPIGTDAGNQAVDTVSITEGFEAAPEAFVQIANYSAAAVVKRVELAVDGTLYDARDLSVPAHGRASFVIALPDAAHVVEARLGGGDALATDDAAWSVRPRSGRARVSLVSPGNRFLESALSLMPGVEGVRLYTGEDAEGPFGLTDVAVLDTLVPQQLPPGNLLVIGPMRSIGPQEGVAASEAIEVAGTLSGPAPRVVDETGLAMGAELDQVAILEAAALRLGNGWDTVVVTEVAGVTWPLVATGTLLGRPAVLIAFDLRQSDLPLRTAFPLVMARALEQLSPSTLAGLPAAVTAGQPIAFQASPRVRKLQVTTPEGRRFDLEPLPSGVRFADTDAPGIYELAVTTDSGSETSEFAVNMAAERESDIRPRGVAPAEDEAIVAGVHGPSTGRREFWWPLAVLALATVCVEWAVYHRRAFSQLAASPRTLWERARPRQ